MTDELKKALENVLVLASVGANETFTDMTSFNKNMHDILVVEMDLLGKAR
jgi:hypothetical protein